jgi:hypothetical protein
MQVTRASHNDKARIYIVVAREVNGKQLSTGRMAAQAAHAISQMWGAAGDIETYNTIILEANDELDLKGAEEELSAFGIPYTSFYDNDTFYGTDSDVFTAVCAFPVSFENGEERPLAYFPTLN